MRPLIAARIRDFIAENFLFRDDNAALADTDSLLEAGLIDSTGVLELVGFIEQEFQIEMADDEVTPEHLDSVAAIAAYVERKRSAHGATAAAEPRPEHAL